LWACALVAALVGPVLLSLVTGTDNALAAQFAVQTGLLATGLMVCVVIAPSRLRSLTRALGIEGVLGVHRVLGMLLTVVVLLHLVAVVVANPVSITLLDPRQWTPASRAATGATVGLIALVGLAVLRHRVRHRYALWRWVHLLLTGGVLAGTALHIWFLQHLVNDPVLRVTFGVLAAALLGVLSHRWVWRPAFDTQGAYEVREVRPETEDVHTLVIGPRRPKHGFDASAMEFEPVRLAAAAQVGDRRGASVHHHLMSSGQRHGRVHHPQRGRLHRQVGPTAPRGPHLDRRSARRVHLGRTGLPAGTGVHRGRGRHHPDDEHVASPGRAGRHPPGVAAFRCSYRRRAAVPRRAA
jgi:hypothetical protein